MQKILSAMRRAIIDYDMIQDGKFDKSVLRHNYKTVVFHNSDGARNARSAVAEFFRYFDR